MMTADMKPVTALEILKNLERTNCGECGLPTCMAFAAQVVQGQRTLSECPRLDPGSARQLNGAIADAPARGDWTGEEALQNLQARFADVDIAARAERLGGWMREQNLTFHCLGKLFGIDSRGGLHSECHQNPWLHVPLLSYVLDGAGREPAGDWIRFAELRKARSWLRFFEHRCEEPLREMAERDATMLLDVLDLFASRRQVRGFEADATFVLHPLPRVPFLFSYQRPEGDLPAGFSVYLDRTADDNLDPESLFRLGSGMARMFERIALRHGYSPRGVSRAP